MSRIVAQNGIIFLNEREVLYMINSLTIVILVVGGLVLFSCYATYVSVIQKKNKVQDAFASIDVQLKMRYDLIPNILQIANKFMEHERNLLEKVTELRTQALALANIPQNMGKKFELDSQIRDLMGQIMVSVENYPNLKSDQTMITAMQTYNEVEAHIAAARRFYNSAVLELNNACEIFPSSIFAAMVGAKKQEFFKASEVERQAVNAGDYLK